MKRTLTDREVNAAIRAAKPAWLHQNLGSGQGSLSLRVWETGAAWYYSYNVQGKTRRLLIEPGEEHGDKMLTLAQANAKALELAVERRGAPGGDLIAWRKTKEEEKRRTEAEQLALANAKKLRTVAKLFANYIQDLRDRNKSSVIEVERALHMVLRDFPELPHRDAGSIAAQEWVAVLRRYGKTEGKANKMRKVRSYVRAAYALAIRADLDPLKDESAGMMLTNNPLDGIPAGASRARTRVLSEDEFRALWARLQGDDPIAMTLRALILLGGQRLGQLTRATIRDYRDGELTLFDPKGKRAEPRRHVLPVQGMAKALLDEMADRARLLGTGYLFTVSGKCAIGIDTATHYVGRLMTAMLDDGEITESFVLSDIRRSLETIMGGKLRISKDDRAQVQSHGISGIQEKHYDHSTHLDAKKEALAKLERWLMQEPGTVVALRAGVAS